MVFGLLDIAAIDYETIGQFTEPAGRFPFKGTVKTSDYNSGTKLCVHYISVIVTVKVGHAQLIGRQRFKQVSLAAVLTAR